MALDHSNSSNLEQLALKGLTGLAVRPTYLSVNFGFTAILFSTFYRASICEGGLGSRNSCLLYTSDAADE